MRLRHKIASAIVMLLLLGTAGATRADPWLGFFGFQCNADPITGAEQVTVESGSPLYQSLTKCKLKVEQEGATRRYRSTCAADRATVETDGWDLTRTQEVRLCDQVYYCFDPSSTLSTLLSVNATHIGIGYWPKGFKVNWPQTMCIDRLDPS